MERMADVIARLDRIIELLEASQVRRWEDLPLDQKYRESVKYLTTRRVATNAIAGPKTDRGVR